MLLQTLYRHDASASNCIFALVLANHWIRGARRADYSTKPILIEKLHQGMTQIKQSPSVKQRLAFNGAIPFDMPLAGMSAYLQSELDEWTCVIEAAGINPG